MSGQVVVLVVVELDPAVFAPEAVTDETTQFNRQLADLLANSPPLPSMEPERVRELRREGKGIFGPPVYSELATTQVIPGPAGEIPIRVLKADEPNGVYLHLHGGGFVLGGEDLQDPWLEAMVEDAGVAVVSVGYRLAPEHLYPASADDCEAAARWLVDAAESEFGSETLFIGGESAGAHLAVTTLLRIRDRHGFTGFSGANLVYGGYLVEMSPSTRLWDQGRLVLDRETIEWFHRHAFPPQLDPTDPDAAPLYADLANLPPALFTVGTLDPLLDNTLFMAARWSAAGNSTDLSVYPGGVHAFDAFPIEIGLRARAHMHRWIKERS